MKKRGIWIGSAIASILAFPAFAQTVTSEPPSASAADPGGDIVVTAQKRSERLQDVPVPVTVLSSATLLARNQNRLVDYFATVPSFSLNAQGNGQVAISIRGITTGQSTNPAVGIVIDDVPYGSSTYLGYGTRLLPDIDPAILERVEVLRGPQGTLYGASNIGGLLKFVTADPSLSGVSGRVQGDLSGVAHGEVGFGLRGAVNAPVSDTIAIRASGFYKRDGGYVDNVTTGKDDVNRVNTYGGHLIALWKPSSDVSLKLSAILQDTQGYGTAEVNGNYLLVPTIGALSQTRIPDTGQYHVKVRLYSAVLNASLGGTVLTTVTGYGVNNYFGYLDQTPQRGGTALSLAGVTYARLINDFNTKKFSQEVRLSSSGKHFIDWIIGAFYTHEDTDARQIAQAINQNTGAVAGTLFNIPFPTTLREIAGFGSATVNLASRFDIQLGGRYSSNRQTYRETDSGLLYPVPISASADSSDSAFTFQVTPRFRLSDSFMTYARIASGYRVGGPNPGAPFGFPSTYGHDTTVNYEIGVKGNTPDRVLTYDLSLFYVDWKDIQIAARDPTTGFVYYVNGKGASSKGVEASVTLRPWNGMVINTNGAYNDAKLDDDLPVGGGGGLKGDRLPFNARFTGSVLVDQDFRLSDRVTGFVGGTLSYVGGRRGDFPRNLTLVRLTYPEYTTADLRGGVRFDGWSMSAFVTNVGDKRGVVGAQSRLATTTMAAPYGISYIRPRTIGLTVARTF